MTQKLRFIGNGRFKETAIEFTNAKLYEDFILMQALYLKAKGLHVKQKYIKKNIKGFTYEVYMTHAGPVWFKKPYIDIEKLYSVTSGR